MIHPNSTPSMTRAEAVCFRREMLRRMHGDLTERERAQLEWREKVYAEILRNNGGKNPLFPC